MPHATASNLFARNLGSTLGATVLGAGLTASLAGCHAGSPDQIQQLLHASGSAIGAVEGRAGLAHGLHLTFWDVLIIAAATLALSLSVLRTTSDGRAEGGEPRLDRP